MASWAEFEKSAPDMAAEGRRLLYQFGVGLAFLATVRKDGGPRLHPICPIVAEGGLYAFMIHSLKAADLRRDGRYALHAFLPEDIDDEFYLTGRAVEVLDPGIRASVDAAYENDVAEDHILFGFDIERCLLAIYRARGEFPPTYTRWADPAI